MSIKKESTVLTELQADHALGLVVLGFDNDQTGPIRSLFKGTPKRMLPRLIDSLRKEGFDPNDLLQWLSLIVSLIPQYGPILSVLLKAVIEALAAKGVQPRTTTGAVSPLVVE